MNPAHWKPALLPIIVLLVVTAGGWLIRSNTGSAKTSEVPRADEQTATAVGTPVAGETPKAGEPTNAGNIPLAAVAPKAGGSPGNDEDRHQLLETVGILTAAHSYQTYLNIGLLADGKAKGIYTDKDASKVLDSVLALLDSVDQKLARLAKIDLEKQDRDSLEQMRDLSDLLRQQAKQLAAFWNSGKDEDGAHYENVRKDSWAAISKLMGIGR